MNLTYNHATFFTLILKDFKRSFYIYIVVRSNQVTRHLLNKNYRIWIWNIKTWRAVTQKRKKKSILPCFPSILPFIRGFQLIWTQKHSLVVSAQYWLQIVPTLKLSMFASCIILKSFLWLQTNKNDPIVKQGFIVENIVQSLFQSLGWKVNRRYFQCIYEKKSHQQKSDQKLRTINE